MLKRLFTFVFISALIFSSTGCRKSFPIADYIGDKSFSLTDQSGKNVKFPQDFEKSLTIVSFIFTRCPDICPLNTNNIRLIKEKVEFAKLKNVKFVSITFDPERDSAAIFNDYIKIRELETTNWQFLTGERKEIAALMKVMNIIAIPSDTTFTKEKEPVYFFTHTDRITLVDQKLRIRAEYSGSKPNIDEIFNDIKSLGD